MNHTIQPEKQKLNVELFGQKYTFRAEADERQKLLDIAGHVDYMMHKIGDNQPKLDYRDVAVLAAMNIAEELIKYKRFTVIMLGGHVRFNSHSTIGPLTLNTLSHFANYKLFLGVDSFSFDNGISTPNMEEAMLNQAMIAQASEVILVFDSSKFNKRSFCHIANVDQIHTIVTDHGLPVGSSSRLKEHNINLLLA